MNKYLVITPEYDVVEPVTDEGQGPTITVADVIEIEAESSRDAVAFGVRVMLKDTHYHRCDRFCYCQDQRSDHRSPYSGVKAISIDELPEA